MSKRKLLPNRLLCIFLAALTLLSFFGCGEKQAFADSEAETAGAVTFTDALGREVSVKKNPKRVAALIGSFADVWLLSGGKLCASADDAWDDFGLDLGDAVNIGGAHSPNLELLIAAAPDFVIASASTSANVEIKDTLEQLGIAVAYFDVDCFGDYLNMLKICTDLTGRSDLYEKNGIEIKKQIESVKGKLNISDNQRKILLLRASSGSVKAKNSQGTVLGEMLCDMGCINIADSDKALLENLSIESIMQNQPYRIFVVTMGNDSEKARNNLYEMIKQNPAWGSLDAIKENRLHFMDRKLFNLKPNARWAEAYGQLYEILHS